MGPLTPMWGWPSTILRHPENSIEGRMTQEEAKRFLDAFRDGRARTLVHEMMEQYYAEAVLENHPKSASLNRGEIHRQTRDLCTDIFGSVAQVTDDPQALYPLLSRLSRGHRPMAAFWFPEFNEAYENYKHRRKLEIKLEQLKPFLGTGSYADIGCGGGDLVGYLKENYGKFSSYTGIDVMDWRSESVREKIDFRMFNFAHPEGTLADTFDFATCMAVIHHVGRDEASRLRFLRNIRESLNPGGRLLVEEDVMLLPEEIAANSGYQQETGQLRKEQPLYGAYLDLGRQEQEHVLILIDLLANSLTVGVPDMDFPFGFLSIDEWIRLFRKAGYVHEKIKITGFVRGTFNRSSHVIYLLRRN